MDAMKKENYIWSAIKTGLLGGVIAIFICLIGMVEIFSKRDVIEKTLTLGQFVLLATGVFIGFVASRRTSSLLKQNKPLPTLLSGLIAGLITGALLALLVLIGDKVNLRAVFLNASPTLYKLLTFGKGVGNAWALVEIGAASGLLGSAYLTLPNLFQGPVNRALFFTIFMALFSGLFRVIMINQGPAMGKAAKYLFGQSGLSMEGT
jgi:divalent metal cation (Fe/Co/Zn/Cd) transporter